MSAHPRVSAAGRFGLALPPRRRDETRVPLPDDWAEAQAAEAASGSAPALSGVPETMLWTLHARAAEHDRPDRLLRDARAAALMRRIDYDFGGRYGPPNRLFAVRAALLDGCLRRWLRSHPAGLVVSLGEGLETQAWRVDNGRLRWLSVDLPEALAVRERFLPAGGRFRHLPGDAATLGWLDAVDEPAVFVLAQGLFMYLQPEQVRRILCAVVAQCPRAELAFDVVPRWLSESTCRSHAAGEACAVPPMPWGLDRDEIRACLTGWLPGLRVRFLPYRAPGRYPMRVAETRDILLGRHARPSLVHVRAVP